MATEANLFEHEVVKKNIAALKTAILNLAMVGVEVEASVEEGVTAVELRDVGDQLKNRVAFSNAYAVEAFEIDAPDTRLLPDELRAE